MVNRLSFFCTILFMLLAVHTHAATPKLTQQQKPIAQVLRNDSTKIQLREFNDKQLDQYAQSKDFQYTDAPTLQMSWWDRFWNWVWQSIRNVLRGVSGNKSSWLFFRIVLFTLAAGALAFIIFKILGIDIVKILKGESQSIEIPYDESLENIHEINFDTEIDNAIANHNYRIAVRLLYLRALKQLSDAQLIHWQIEKTNAAYLNELTDNHQKQLFGLLTTQFEYVWYGDFPVDGQSFQNINTMFHDFKQSL